MGSGKGQADAEDPRTEIEIFPESRYGVWKLVPAFKAAVSRRTPYKIDDKDTHSALDLILLDWTGPFGWKDDPVHRLS